MSSRGNFFSPSRKAGADPLWSPPTSPILWFCHQFLPVWNVKENGVFSSRRLSWLACWAIIKPLGFLSCQKLFSLQPGCCTLLPTHVLEFPVHLWTPGTEISTMVGPIRFRLKIWGVAKMPMVSHPFDLTFTSGFQLTTLQTSANFFNVFKTSSSFCVRLGCDRNVLARPTTSFHLYSAYRNVDIIIIRLQRVLLSFQLVD